jgi:hypothetical protein
MRLGIMQPYFLPYIGYWQLIQSVDQFVVYDNIKYTKKGWINRNRILLNGKDVMISIPLSKASDSLDIVEREISPEFDPKSLLAQLSGTYRKAPFFDETLQLLEKILYCRERNLFHFIHHSISCICVYLSIPTPIIVSSKVDADPNLKGVERVMSLCKAMGSSFYINPIGGRELYSREEFDAQGIKLKFLAPKPFEYSQFGSGFLPSLSIADVMMFNSAERIREHLCTPVELI